MFLFHVCLFVCLCTADQLVRSVDNIVEVPNAMDSRFGKHV